MTGHTKFRVAIRTYRTLLRNGFGPAVLWHYSRDSLHYLLVKRSVLSSPARHVSEVRATFDAHAAQGQFREEWFDRNIVPWSVTFARVFKRADPVCVLEIGSWEGRSTLFLLTYFTEGRLTAVDTWAGSDENQDHTLQELESLESRFDGNLVPCANRITKRKGSSLQVLPQLLHEQREFDVIYVDGSHFADDVLTDGLNAWRLLKHDGVLIFDDLAWNYYPRAHDNPGWPINTFLKFHAGKYKILSAAGNQIILQKKCSG